MPRSSPSGISSVRPVAEADDLGRDRLPVAAARDDAHLADRRAQAGRLDHEADQVRDEPAADAQVRAHERLGRVVEHALRHADERERVADDLGGARELRGGGAVDLGVVGVDDAAAAVDAALGDDVDAAEAADGVGDSGDRAADELEVVGVHLDDDPPAILQAAERARDDVHDELGPHVERGADDLLGERDRQLGGLPLDAARDGRAPRRRARARPTASAASASVTRARPSSSPAA